MKETSTNQMFCYNIMVITKRNTSKKRKYPTTVSLLQCTTYCQSFYQFCTYGNYPVKNISEILNQNSSIFQHETYLKLCYIKININFYTHHQLSYFPNKFSATIYAKLLALYCKFRCYSHFDIN